MFLEKLTKNNCIKIIDINLYSTLFIGEYEILSVNIKKGKYSVYDINGKILICPSNKKISEISKVELNELREIQNESKSIVFYNGDLFKYLFERNKMFGVNISELFTPYNYYNNYMIITKDLLQYSLMHAIKNNNAWINADKDINYLNKNRLNKSIKILEKQISIIKNYKENIVGCAVLNNNIKYFVKVFGNKNENIYVINL